MAHAAAPLGGGAWERAVPVAVRAGDKEERTEELTLRIALAPPKHAHAGRVRIARAGRTRCAASRADTRCASAGAVRARAVAARRPGCLLPGARR
jgi:hypothetical protein